MVESVTEESAIREPGEAVVEGLMRQLLFQFDALGDVACVEHDAVHRFVLAEVGHVCLEVPPIA